MSRDIPSALLAEFEGENLQPYIAVEIVFDTGVTRVWGGYGQIYIDGQPYLGTGILGNISAIGESTENKASGISLNISGVPNDILAAALRQNYQGRSCTVYLGVIDGSYNGTRQQVGTPIVLFKGTTDRMSINQGADSASISVTVENRLIDLERPRIRRYTPEDQKVYWPDDEGFSFVSYIQDREVPWGVSTET